MNRGVDNWDYTHQRNVVPGSQHCLVAMQRGEGSLITGQDNVQLQFGTLIVKEQQAIPEAGQKW